MSKSIVTPVGIAQWPHLVEPDDYEGSLNYKTDLLLDPNDKGVSEFIKHLNDAADKAYEEGVAELMTKGGKSVALAKQITKKVPIQPQYDDEGNETGLVLVSMKSKASGVTATGKKWSRTVPLFDSGKGKDRPEKIPHGSVDVWGGSLIKVEVEVYPYCATGLKLAGVSLRIISAQILQLSEGSTSGGNNFGVEEDFDAVEGASNTDSYVDEPEASDGDF